MSASETEPDNRWNLDRWLKFVQLIAQIIGVLIGLATLAGLIGWIPHLRLIAS